MKARDIIEQLNLKPHPEGGWYAETWKSAALQGRPSGTAIFYLLESGQKSHWHFVDADEIWHFYAGAPLILSISETDEGPAKDRALGSRLDLGEVPQIIVPAGHWQAARSTGDWTLVGCTVSPGFQFEGFTLAPADFDIPRG